MLLLIACVAAVRPAFGDQEDKSKLISAACGFAAKRFVEHELKMPIEQIEKSRHIVLERVLLSQDKVTEDGPHALAMFEEVAIVFKRPPGMAFNVMSSLNYAYSCGVRVEIGEDRKSCSPLGARCEDLSGSDLREGVLTRLLGSYKDKK